VAKGNRGGREGRRSGFAVKNRGAPQTSMGGGERRKSDGAQSKKNEGVAGGEEKFSLKEGEGEIDWAKKGKDGIEKGGNWAAVEYGKKKKLGRQFSTRSNEPAKFQWEGGGPSSLATGEGKEKVPVPTIRKRTDFPFHLQRAPSKREREENSFVFHKKIPLLFSLSPRGPSAREKKRGLPKKKVKLYQKGFITTWGQLKGRLRIGGRKEIEPHEKNRLWNGVFEGQGEKAGVSVPQGELDEC